MGIRMTEYELRHLIALREGQTQEFKLILSEDKGWALGSDWQMKV